MHLNANFKLPIFKIWLLSLILALLPFLFLVLKVFNSAVPGLLDDGTHIWFARNYCEGNFLKLVFDSVKQVFIGGARFYEFQYIYLAGLDCAFGLNLSWWYIGNFSFVILTAGIVSFLTFKICGNRWICLLPGLVVLYNSSVLEAAGANFGKAEGMQCLFLCLGLLFFPFKLFIEDEQKEKIRYFAISLFFTCFALTKESSKIVILLFTFIFVLNAFLRPSLLRKRQFVLTVIALTIPLLINLAIHIASRANPYLNNYFTLDFSEQHLKESIEYYKEYTPDIFYGLYLCGFMALWTLITEKFRKIDLRHFTFFVPALAFYFALLAFRFRTTYYVYPVSVLLALQYGLSLSILFRNRRIFALFVSACLLAGCVYSIPLMFSQRHVQAIFDSLNFDAIKQAGDAKTIFIDFEEVEQPVQEWNHIEAQYFGVSSPKAYGLFSGFRAMDYQDSIRSIPARGELNWLNYWKNVNYINGWREIKPEPGNLILSRNAKILVQGISIRAAAPLIAIGSEPAMLPKEDLQIISEKNEERFIINPKRWVREPINYGFKLYRILDPIHFYLRNLGRNNSIKEKFSIATVKTENCAFSRLTLDLGKDAKYSFLADNDRKKIKPSFINGSRAEFFIKLNAGEERELFVFENEQKKAQNPTVIGAACSKVAKK